MSKVIKRHRDGEVELYDFHEIQFSSSTVAFLGQDAGASEPGSAEPAEKERGPSEDEQEAIRARLQEAERMAQEIEKNAYEKGYAQGQKDGFEYGIKSAFVVKEQLQGLLSTMSALPEQMYRDYRDWFLSTSLAVAKKIIQQEISSDPGILVRMMDDLLTKAEADQNLVIYVSRKDHELLKKHKEFGAWLGEKAGSVSVKSDPGLKVGICRLESDVQLIDASVDTQMEMIHEFIKKNVHTSEAGGTA